MPAGAARAPHLGSTAMDLPYLRSYPAHLQDQVRALLSPLSALHHRVLELLGLSAGIYERLIAHFLEPALVLSEP